MNSLMEKAVKILDEPTGFSTAQLYAQVAKGFVYALLALVEELQIYNSYHIPSRNREHVNEEINTLLGTDKS